MYVAYKMAARFPGHNIMWKINLTIYSLHLVVHIWLVLTPNTDLKTKQRVYDMIKVKLMPVATRLILVCLHITMTSYSRTSRRLESTLIRLYGQQPFPVDKKKKKGKVHTIAILWGKSTGHRWFPHPYGQQCGKRVDDMPSPWFINVRYSWYQPARASSSSPPPPPPPPLLSS